MNLTALKSSFTSTLLAGSLAFAALAPCARGVAQNSSDRVVADIPFTFRSGSEVMPAGKYQIEAVSDHVLMVRGAGQHRSQFLLTLHAETIHPSARGKLVFHRYGDRYFLYQIWSANQSIGFELPKSHAETETLRAENNPAPSTTELALNDGAQH
jgi:hypothetical protein